MSSAPTTSGVRRREFLKVLGAGTVASTAIGCGSDHVKRMIPYLVTPDGTVPGVSNYYASTCRECAAGCGIMVETRDGRSIKIEGNPAHPLNHGALCARGQAALQGLYNPDRYRQPMARTGAGLVPISWDEAIQLFSRQLDQLRHGGHAGDAAFVNLHESGSFPGFLDDWLAAWGMPAHVSVDGELPVAVLAANRQSYGVAWPSLDFAAATLIVSFGADFLDAWGANVPQQLSFADARGKLATAPRVVFIGARRSLTGLNADDWIPAKPGSELLIAQAILSHLAPGAAGVTGGATIEQAAAASGVASATLQQLAEALAAARPSLVLAGGSGPDALELALAVNAINQAAGNVGHTINPAAPLMGFDGASGHGALRGLAERMTAGAVPLLMVRGVNPVYATPRALGFAAAMAKVPFKVSFSSYPDETAELCDLVLPDNHSLESWGDAEPIRGTISLVQPAMDPVFATRQTADVLLAAMKGDPALAARFPWPDYRTWMIDRFPGGAAAFANALTRGMTEAPASPPAPRHTASASRAVSHPAASLPTTAAPANPGTGDFDLVVYPSATLGDGRGANKPWLQELPDPVSKIVWQTWAELHPETAAKLAIEAGDLLRIETTAGTITAPAWIYMGVRTDTVAIALGRGHTAYGRYAKGVGVNALDVLGVAEDHAGGLALTTMRARVTRTGDSVHLVTTEGSARQHGRGIAQAVTAAELAAPARQPEVEVMPGDASHAFEPGLRSPVANDAQGDYGNPASKDLGMYDADHWSGMAKRRWAMTVDLARCTGCSACITACYAENNIPTVGAPWQVGTILPADTGFGANILRGREMTWMRLERYFEGAEHRDGAFDPTFETRFIPMLCQHCGNAPCEPVCPVYATYHSPDGLNVQVYNRCVGTRYCSNNCPYKVRYFNWFGYGEPNRPQYAFPEPLNWQLNPDVTVRGKGVMEKCTFCVQRIREAEHRARLEGRGLAPDEFTVACAQGCPSRAITFGDVADPAWTVTKRAGDRRAYHVFEELNTYTAIVYLKKVTHPAPSGAGGA